jgi:hypothetical protein
MKNYNKNCNAQTFSNHRCIKTKSFQQKNVKGQTLPNVKFCVIWSVGKADSKFDP